MSSMKKQAKRAGTMKKTVKALYKDPTMDSSIHMKEDAVKDALAKRAAFLCEAFEFMGNYASRLAGSTAHPGCAARH